MSRLLDDWRHFLAVSTVWLSRGYIFISLFNPLTPLCACIIALVYLYLRYEHLFNPRLVASTPPSPDAHLPSRAEWLANGGLARVSSSAPQREGSDDDSCIICYEPLTEPTKISPCGHVFCRDCIDKWHSQGQRSCPQCTVKLWRTTRPDERTQTETLELEPLVKFTAAATIVLVPLNLLTLYACLTYHIFDPSATRGTCTAMIMLLGFISFSAALLTISSQGWQWMMQRRREQGVRWWGGDVDADEDQPYRMAFTAFSLVAACWVAALCSLLELHSRGAYGDISALTVLRDLSGRVVLGLAR